MLRAAEAAARRTQRRVPAIRTIGSIAGAKLVWRRRARGDGVQFVVEFGILGLAAGGAYGLLALSITVIFGLPAS